MNAKITITVPVDKLNVTVSGMLESVASELEMSSIDLTGVSKSVLQESDILKQMESIEVARKKLVLLDANLEDCYSILSGLVRYRTQQDAGQKNVEQSAE